MLKRGVVLFFAILVLSCQEEVVIDKYNWMPMEVTATAYNSIPNQTSYEHPCNYGMGRLHKTRKKMDSRL